MCVEVYSNEEFRKKFVTKKGKTKVRSQAKKKTDTSPDVFQQLIKQDFNLSCKSEYRFDEVRKFLFDYAIPSHMIAIEKEGGIYTGQAHGSITGILRDVEKYNLATSLGWSVIRVLPRDLLKKQTFELIKKVKENYENLQQKGNIT